LVLISHNTEIPGIEGETRVLVPKKTLVELSKLAADDVEGIEFGNTENHLFFKVGERLLVSRILTGQFPNYEMVIPRENHRDLVLSTLEFGDALKRAAIMADEQSRAIKLNILENQVELSSASSDVGEAKENLEAKYSSEPMEIGFNAQYLLDFLQNADSQEVVISLRDKETQGLMKPKGLEDYDYYYVVMPMKI
jgi:DNA polymerase-3 subunit beta